MNKSNPLQISPPFPPEIRLEMKAKTPECPEPTPVDPVLPIVALEPKERVDKWTVAKVLGQGAFGAVYEVYEGQETARSYALKVENSQTKVHMLKMEVVVMQALSKAKAAHSCELVDTGRTRSFFYIVMTLVGRSLGVLRKAQKESCFSAGCAISVSMQCLEAVQELHNVGYLHRDLKPYNFAVGLENPRRIMLFDFGMCRKYVEAENFHRKPRASAGFRGTLRYASLRAHDCLELSRKDDLESWLYQTVELTSGCLPWSHLVDILAVQEMKQAARQPDKMRQLLGGCPKEYVYLLLCVDKLDYYENPKYGILRGLLRDALQANKLQEFPYDWEKPETASRKLCLSLVLWKENGRNPLTGELYNRKMRNFVYNGKTWLPRKARIMMIQYTAKQRTFSDTGHDWTEAIYDRAAKEGYHRGGTKTYAAVDKIVEYWKATSPVKPKALMVLITDGSIRDPEVTSIKNAQGQNIDVKLIPVNLDLQQLEAIKNRGIFKDEDIIAMNSYEDLAKGLEEKIEKEWCTTADFDAAMEL